MEGIQTPARADGASFILFLAGMPSRDAGPGGQSRHFSANFMGPAPLGSTSGGGTEPADLLPDQIYREQAREGRRVLAIARTLRCRVKVVDVSDPRGDGALAMKYVGPDYEPPLLVRPDGARLSGGGEFVPGTIRRFLSGR